MHFICKVINWPVSFGGDNFFLFSINCLREKDCMRLPRPHFSVIQINFIFIDFFKNLQCKLYVLHF